MKIGFVGLGQMGKHMATNLHRRNADTCVYDANPEALSGLADAGVPAADSLGDLARRSDAVLLSLPNTEVVERVLFGEGGIVENAKPGLIVIDLGTTAYMPTLDFGERLAERGIRFADAPISGMESRARAGELTLMYGGAEDVFESMRPYFEMFTNCIVQLGPLGSGQLGKLINQLLFDINAASLSEMLALAAKLDLDAEKTLQIVNTGTGRSWASEFFGPRIAADDFSEGYALGSAYKDLVSASEISAWQRIPLPILSAATAVYQMALCKGLDRENKGSMVKVYEEFLGVKFRKR